MSYKVNTLKDGTKRYLFSCDADHNGRKCESTREIDSRGSKTTLMFRMREKGWRRLRKGGTKDICVKCVPHYFEDMC